MPIVGIGVDVVDVTRFSTAVRRTPGLLSRVLVPAETGGRPASMAARFAAKEALAKALGAPAGLRWHDAMVTSDSRGRPTFVVTGSVAEACTRAGAAAVHLSLSHDAGLAVATVVLES